MRRTSDAFFEEHCSPNLAHSHHLFLLTFNDKLFLAPIQNPKNVLDVGTGTGIWAQ